MALSWPASGAASTTYLNMNVTTLGAMGTGSYTMLGLVLPYSSIGALGALYVGTSNGIEIIIDSGLFYGSGDFETPPYSADTSGTKWQWICQRKLSGSNGYLWSYKNRTDNGTLTHTQATNTHANPGTITAFRIGQGDNGGRNGIAVYTLWKRFLSDAEVATAMSDNASSLASLSPDALYLFNVASASAVVDSSGNGNSLIGVVGTASSITTIADPTFYNFSLGGGPVTDSDSFAFSETERIVVRDSESFALTDTTLKLGVADSDTVLLTETQRGNVSASESFMLDDSQTVRISVTASDSFALAVELAVLGLTLVDAFTVSDAVFAGHGSVVSGDTFALIEHEQIGGLPESPIPSVPITITLTSPSLSMSLGVPNLTIALTTPSATVE